MNSITSDCYKNSPRSIEDDIPVFSDTDFYVENYERISGDHLKHFEATGHNPFMREDHWHEIESSTEELIRKYSTSSKVRILDVGVGMGRLLERFPNLERFGMDISRGYLNYAKSKGIEVCMARIEEMPYKDKYFDLLVTTDVLEHVLDLNLVLNKILAVVKDGGIIIVRVPYKENLSGYVQAGYPYELVHLRTFDEYSLRILFEKIFNVQVLEWNVTGFRGGRIRFGEKVRYFAGMVYRLLNLTRKFNDQLYQSLSRKLCNPVEINMVVRNVKIKPFRP